MLKDHKLRHGYLMLSKTGVVNSKKYTDHLMKRTTEFKFSDKTSLKLNKSLKKETRNSLLPSMNSLISLKKNSELNTLLLLLKNQQEKILNFQLKISQNLLTGLNKVLLTLLKIKLNAVHVGLSQLLLLLKLSMPSKLKNLQDSLNNSLLTVLEVYTEMKVVMVVSWILLSNILLTTELN